MCDDVLIFKFLNLYQFWFVVVFICLDLLDVYLSTHINANYIVYYIMYYMLQDSLYALT